MPNIVWNKWSDPTGMFPAQHTANACKVGIRFNPDGGGQIAFSVQGRMTYKRPIKNMKAAKAYVEARFEELCKVRTMVQLLKVIN